MVCAGAGPTVRNYGTDGRTRATGTPHTGPPRGGGVGMYLTCDTGTDGRNDTRPHPDSRRPAGHHLLQPRGFAPRTPLQPHSLALGRSLRSAGSFASLTRR